MTLAVQPPINGRHMASAVCGSDAEPTGRRDGHGNYYRYRGVVHLASGATVPIWDVFLAVRPGAGAEAAAWPDGDASDGWRAGVAGLGAGLLAFGLVALVRRRDGRVAAVRPARVPAFARVGAGGLTTLALVLLSPSSTFGQTWQVVEYYDTDAVGSVRVVTDAQGAVVAGHDFLPFGEELSPQTPPHDKKLFTGQERDVETGQDYFGARYYRADLGRFATVDPVTTIEENVPDPQRWNCYAYARNDSLNYTDPTGAVLEANGDIGLLRQWARESVGEDAAEYVDVEWNKKARRWEFSISGIDLAAFRKLSAAASRFADIVSDARLAIVKQTTTEALPEGNAGWTFDLGERNGNASPVVLLNQDHYGANAVSAQGIPFRNKFDDPDNVRTLTMGIIMFHELGHAWANMHGLRTALGQSGASAIDWENAARRAIYSNVPNAMRRIH